MHLTSSIDLKNWQWWPSTAKHVLIVMALIMAILFTWFWTFQPQRAGLQDWQQREHVLLNENAVLQSQLQRDKKLHSMSDAQQELENSIQDSGLKLQTLAISNSEQKDKQGKEEIKIAVSLIGQISHIQTFIATLQASNWHWELEKLEIKGTNQNEQTVNLSLIPYEFIEIPESVKQPSSTKWQDKLFMAKAKSTPRGVKKQVTDKLANLNIAASLAKLQEVSIKPVLGKLPPLNLVNLESTKESPAINIQLLGIVEEAGIHYAVVKWEGKNFYLRKGDQLEKTDIRVERVDENRLWVSQDKRKQVFELGKGADG